MPYKFNHTKEFSKRAKSYTSNNIIQKKVAKHLISNISSKPKKILDLGSGLGLIYDLIDWNIDNFIGVDLAKDMSLKHPKAKHVEIKIADFDDKRLYDSFDSFDITIASSSLQWSKDLPNTLKLICKHTKEIAFAIFCDKTFKTIYDLSTLETFLPSANLTIKEIEKYFDIEYEIKEYKLEFEDNLSIFRYIKNSGVSGGKRQLSYKDTKKLIESYPLNYLEFEVLFVWSKAKEG
jgi:malonyl-CoA O-methyltransferase